MDDIYYSPRYQDDTFEYRHVILPKINMNKIPAGRLMSEAEWRRAGVQQSIGWEHYMIHNPEKHILLFRRRLNFSKQDEEKAKRLLTAEMEKYEKAKCAMKLK